MKSVTQIENAIAKMDRAIEDGRLTSDFGHATVYAIKSTLEWVLSNDAINSGIAGEWIANTEYHLGREFTQRVSS